MSFPMLEDVLPTLPKENVCKLRIYVDRNHRELEVDGEVSEIVARCRILTFQFDRAYRFTSFS